MKFPWLIVIAIGALVAFLGLRLGYKSMVLTETQLIDHYAKAFLAQMEATDQIVDSGDCHAVVGQTAWERLRVNCVTPSGAIWSYRVGWWGQVINGRPELIEGAQ